MKIVLNGYFLTDQFKHQGMGRYARGYADILSSILPPSKLRILIPSFADTKEAALAQEYYEVVPFAQNYKTKPTANEFINNIILNGVAALKNPHSPIICFLPSFSIARHPFFLTTFHDCLYRKHPSFTDRSNLREWIRWRGFWVFIENFSRRSHLLTISHYAENQIQELLNWTSRIPKLSNWIDKPTLNPSPRLPVSLQEKLNGRDFILYSGGINPRKDVTTLLNAYSRAASIRDFPALVITGDPNANPDTIKAIDDLDQSSNIHFSGKLSSEELSQLYQLTKLVVYCSTEEGFGLPPLEGIAYGKPIITSALPPIMEYVQNPESLFEPRNTQQLKLKLIEANQYPERFTQEFPKAFGRHHARKRTLDLLESIQKTVSPPVV